MAVLAPTVMVMTELPEPGAGMVCGLNPIAAPVGTPEADSEIELLNPPLIDVVIVDAPWFPWAMVREEGEAEIAKLAALVTVSVVLPLIEPTAALMVVDPAATPVA